MNSTSRITAFLLLAGALFATGSFAREVKSPDFTPSDRNGKALVLLSTSADRAVRSGSTMLMLIRIERKGSKSKLKQLDGFMINNPVLESHSPSSIMNVHWRALEPGEYRLKRVMLNPLACFTVKIAFDFTVTAGQQIYLGEFALRGDDLNVSDAYQRDYDFFASHAGGEHPEVFTPALPEKQVGDDTGCRPMSPY